MDDRKIWFGPKAYGYGFTPVSWEGWAVTGVLVLVVVAAAALVRPIAGPLGVGCAIVVALGVYFWIVARRSAGELGWRWGDRRRK